MQLFLKLRAPSLVVCDSTGERDQHEPDADRPPQERLPQKPGALLDDFVVIVV